MRVLHISETDYEGGAGKVAHDTHCALRRHGVDSIFIAECVRTNDTFTHALTFRNLLLAKILRRMRATLDMLPIRSYSSRSAAAWTVGWLSRGIAHAIRHYHPDIIHLHWVSEVISTKEIGVLRGPVAWTHHDWGAFTGGCRCPVGCERFRHGCGCCPLLDSKKIADITARTCLRKHRLWANVRLHSIGVGKAIAADARSSQVLRDRPCTVIHNGVDTGIFMPGDRLAARARLGISPEEFIILFGSLSLTAAWKGGAALAYALVAWRSRHPEVQTRALTFGHGNLVFDGNGPPVKALGYLRNPSDLADVYQAADVTVVPSRIESFGLVAAESLACGTPVIAFAGTGVSEIVTHGRTGFLVDGWDPEGLVEGLAWAANLVISEREQVRIQCRQEGAARFSLERVAAEHASLYDGMTQGRVK